MGTLGSDLVREARKRTGLTQADLAVRAGKTRSAIARLESGRPDVSLNNVIRLVRLCGFDLELSIVPWDDSNMAQATRLACLTGQQQGIKRHIRLARQLTRLRDAGGQIIPLEQLPIIRNVKPGRCAVGGTCGGLPTAPGFSKRPAASVRREFVMNLVGALQSENQFLRG
jgi:transcriptional regulator with XRE-family HTH domain